MTTENLLRPTRDNVFFAADEYFAATDKVPVVAAICERFDAPKSAAIGVYLAEWKESNADVLLKLGGSKKQLQARIEDLESQLSRAQNSLNSVNLVLHQFQKYVAELAPHLIDGFAKLGDEN